MGQHAQGNILRRCAVACVCVVTAVTAPPFNQASAELGDRHTVLVLGDSVLSVLRWAPESNKPLWQAGYNVINEAWGCQSLLGPGCPGSGGKSALERFVEHRDDPIDIVVVGTGYNDVGEANLRRAMRLISGEAKTQGVPVLWLTYHERSTAARKARLYNAELREVAPRHANITLVDWNKHARRRSTWFSHNGVHMNRLGGTKLGAFLAARLDEHFAASEGQITDGGQVADGG